jgi:AcrR family transcriptional regulator
LTAVRGSVERLAGPAPGRTEKATRKGRQTDEAFREAARLVFACDGYLNAKISDIAAAAGRSVASFYNYYDTKADLLIALAEEFHAEATQLAVLPYRAGLAGEEALREAVAGFWRSYAKRRGELIGIFQAAMIEGRFRDRWLELRGEAKAGKDAPRPLIRPPDPHRSRVRQDGARGPGMDLDRQPARAVR